MIVAAELRRGAASREHVDVVTLRAEPVNGRDGAVRLAVRGRRVRADYEDAHMSSSQAGFHRVEHDVPSIVREHVLAPGLGEARGFVGRGGEERQALRQLELVGEREAAARAIAMPLQHFAAGRSRAPACRRATTP